MRLGAYTANLAEGSQVAEIYGGTVISERHRHRYEVDIAYRERFEAAGVRLCGLSPDGRLPEIIEIPEHPWYIGVQFHPELKSKPFAPHPLFADFVRAAVEHSRLV
jgi:CTP synthase